MAKYNDHKKIGVVLANFPWKDKLSIDINDKQHRNDKQQRERVI
jgi:hypothetical protein